MYALMSEGLHMEEARATSAVLIILVLIINSMSKLVLKKSGDSNE